MFTRLALFDVNRRGFRFPRQALVAPNKQNCEAAIALLTKLAPERLGDELPLKCFAQFLANDGTWFEKDPDTLDWMMDLEEQNQHGTVRPTPTTVTIKKCIPTQERVERKGIMQYLTGRTPFKRSVVTRADGKDYINDGHHNIIAFALCGKTATEVSLYDHDKATK